MPFCDVLDFDEARLTQSFLQDCCADRTFIYDSYFHERDSLEVTNSAGQWLPDKRLVVNGVQ